MKQTKTNTIAYFVDGRAHYKRRVMMREDGTYYVNYAGRKFKVFEYLISFQNRKVLKVIGMNGSCFVDDNGNSITKIEEIEAK